jgi:hypothetical protein
MGSGRRRRRRRRAAVAVAGVAKEEPRRHMFFLWFGTFGLGNSLPGPSPLNRMNVKTYE